MKTCKQPEWRGRIKALSFDTVRLAPNQQRHPASTHSGLFAAARSDSASSRSLSSQIW